MLIKYLCISSDLDSGRVRVTLETDIPNSFPDKSINIRYSPIFSISESPEAIDPFSNGTGKILFFYTLDTYYCIGRLINQLNDGDIPNRTYISHGLASIIIFYQDSDIFNRVYELLSDYVVGYEIWDSENNIINKTTLEIKKGEYPPDYDWDFSLVEQHEKNLFSDILRVQSSHDHKHV